MGVRGSPVALNCIVLGISFIKTLSPKSYILLNRNGIEHHMNPEATARNLLYPTEWIFRLFIAAMLIRIANPQWTYAFPNLGDSFIFLLGYYLLLIAAALWFAVQIWVLMKYVSSRRDNAPLPQ